MFLYGVSQKLFVASINKSENMKALGNSNIDRSAITLLNWRFLGIDQQNVTTLPKNEWDNSISWTNLIYKKNPKLLNKWKVKFYYI